MRIIIQDIRHLKLKQDFLWVGTVTLVTVIMWITYAIYAAFQKSTVDPEITKLLTPLNSSLDQEAINIIDSRYQPPEEFTILVYADDDPNSTAVIPLNRNLNVPSNQTATPSAVTTSTANSSILNPNVSVTPTSNPAPTISYQNETSL